MSRRLSSAEVQSITLRRAGSSTGSKVHLPSTWSELKALASEKVLGAPVHTIRDERGDVIHSDIRLVESGAVLYVSTDSEWVPPPLDEPGVPTAPPVANFGNTSDEAYMAQHSSAIELALTEAVESLLRCKAHRMPRS